MALITIENYRPGMTATEEDYRRLETGDILFFPTTPFEIAFEEREFLLSQKQVGASYHKNISYRPLQDRLKGVDQKDQAAHAKMHRIMRDYSKRAIAFTAFFLPRYAKSWRIDYSSFRPIEEEGRSIAYLARNDLIHVDSFPTRPSHGNRLLRVFTNINPSRPRIWITSDNFEQLAAKYAREAGLPKKPGAARQLQHQLLRFLSGIGLPVVDRSEYDQFMLRFHDFLKKNIAFQQQGRKDRWEFPADSSWICFTDTTSHSCISGQYALEQTFIVNRNSLVWPEKAPIAILEEMVGFPLAKGAG
ncbi:MAG TPA: Kdo hydroxylase family protein [Acidobacteriota bacterium]|jgi:hypothetical protein|nr:Kdo hydroxylase family protein [Acidobacteriota bacterium]